MKKYEQTIFSLIIRIIGVFLCSILIHHISLPNDEKVCSCVLLFVVFYISYFIAYIMESHKNNQTNFFSELISIGFALSLGVYFIHLSHLLCGTTIVFTGIFLISLQHIEAMNAVDKDTVDKD